MTVKTVHLSKNQKKNKKRRPNLRFDILACLTLRGELSKGQTEAILKKRHQSILDSFKILEKEDLIKRGDRIIGRGRFQHKYKITSKGIEALINDDFTNALNFWKIIYGFCYHYHKEGNTDQIDRFFDLFFEKYLHYSNRNYLDLQDFFNNVSKLWFEEYSERSNEISSEQKILEVLAINSPLTTDELKDKTKLDVDAINKILYKHTNEFFISTILPSIKFLVFYNTTQINKNKLYSLFLRHNLIKAINNENNNAKYELTLFGVLLVIKLISYYNIKKIENHYFNQFIFLDYFDKIVENHREKLPLVFGKWNTLKEILKNYAIYNFELILDSIDSFKEKQVSISLGGSKELHYGIKEIILHIRQQMGEFVHKQDVLNADYISNTNYSNKEIQIDDYLSKNSPIIQKSFNMIDLKLRIFQVEKFLNPLELGDTAIKDLSKIFDRYNRTSSEIEVYEEMFAEEISAIYYFNLHSDNQYTTNDYHLPFDSKILKQISNIKPKICLSQILMIDNYINNFYLKWKNDIITFYENTLNNINNLFD